MVYWILLLVVCLSFFLSVLFVFLGKDAKGSERLHQKFAVRKSWLLKTIILKPMDKEPVSVFNLLPYLVSAIHLIVVIPLYIIFWTTNNAHLVSFFDSTLYFIYTIVYIIVFSACMLIWPVINMIVGQKEYKKN